jgi:hypothetical protein
MGGTLDDGIGSNHVDQRDERSMEHRYQLESCANYQIIDTR